MAAGEEAALLAGAPWRRFAVIGDSIAEGIGEATEGFPDQGWADSVAQALERASGEQAFAYLNLGKRDLRAAAIRETQLDGALEFRPDLAAVLAGGNDLLRSRFEPDPVAADIDAMVAALRAGGADVVTFGLYDCSGSPSHPRRTPRPAARPAARAQRPDRRHRRPARRGARRLHQPRGVRRPVAVRQRRAATGTGADTRSPAAHTLRTLAAARLGPIG
ncbi:SGNH/GDSL hydrolase family protein [Yinghuangia aomiensis]